MPSNHNISKSAQELLDQLASTLPKAADDPLISTLIESMERIKATEAAAPEHAPTDTVDHGPR